jgi:hypothetical protein
MQHNSHIIRYYQEQDEQRERNCGGLWDSQW